MKEDTPLDQPRPRGIGDYLGLAARGFCMGTADVVPGVSGGTMAFILGIYEELISSLRMFGQPEFFRAVAKLRVREAARLVNLDFLVAVGAGILTAILTLARLLEYLLTNHPVLVWSFFFGLVLASVVAVGKRLKSWTPGLVVALLAGGIFAFVLVGLVPLQTPDAPWFLIFSGALAICAMILPGISGAFILLLLGKYQYILNAVNERNLPPVIYVGIGAAVGIVTFAQVLGWLFRRYHDVTVAILIGLMVGSLRKVWPWKLDLEWITGSHGERIVTVQKNVLPQWQVSGSFNMEILAALGLIAIGFLAVIVLDAWAARNEPEELQPGS